MSFSALGLLSRLSLFVVVTPILAVMVLRLDGDRHRLCDGSPG
jgi:hypothetical protein